jgi:hypothetical protein
MIRILKKASAALALAAALLLATAVPAQAGTFGGERGAGLWDGLWKWLAALRVPAAARPEPGPAVRTKQGSGIDPDGGPAPAPPPAGGATAGSQAADSGDEGISG